MIPYCPIMSKDCMQGHCAWWNAATDDCHVVSLSKNLGAVSDALDTEAVNLDPVSNALSKIAEAVWAKR
jgi:hypothetical protein